MAIHLIVVLGGGGHSSELLYFLENHFPMPNVDSLSVYSPAEEFFRFADICQIVKRYKLQLKHWKFISRPRICIKQNPFLWPLKFIWTFFIMSFAMAFSEENILLCNGPSTSLPPLIIFALYRVFSCFSKKKQTFKSIFIESITRISDRSLTGKIAYRCSLVDLFLVQWDQCIAQYPKSVYLGKLSL